MDYHLLLKANMTIKLLVFLLSKAVEAETVVKRQ